MNLQRPVLRFLAIALSLGCTAMPLSAETIPELEALSRASTAPANGVSLARRQMGRGDLLDALATLERVLINYPQARDAQLLRASLLCQLDDRAGSTVEFDQLKGRGVTDRALGDAIAACNAITSRRTAR